jgi:hypothetical protein
MSSETRKQEQRLRRNESSRKSKQKKRDAEKAILGEPVVDEPKAAMPCLLNPHAAEIDRQIEAFRKSQKWNTKIINTSHSDFINDFGSNVFTNFVQHTFTKAYLKNIIALIVVENRKTDVMESARKDQYLSDGH